MDYPAQPAQRTVLLDSARETAAGRGQSTGRVPAFRFHSRDFFRPSFTDVLFVALLAVLFVAGKYGMASLLSDGDAGWHIRTGQTILATHTVPVADPYSFTKPGQLWYAWEWLSDVVFALAFRALALKGVTLLAAVICVLASVVIFGYSLWRGGALFIALPLSLLAVGVAAMHFLALAYIFTLLLLAISLWLLEVDRRKPTRRLWLLVPLTVVWTNLHGGFLSMIACVGIVAVGTAVEGCLLPEQRAAKWRQAARYASLAAASLAASLVNPYGWQLHLHTLAYLRSDWIKSVIQEFQAPRFRTESELQFEILLFLGLACCASLLAKRRIAEALLILFWGHEALTSIRHATIFAFVAAPIIAVELSHYWRLGVARSGKKSLIQILAGIERDMAPAFRAPGIWTVAVIVLLILVDRPLQWPKTFPDQVFPVEMVARYHAKLASSRVLTSDEWGDYLLFVNYPSQKVFFDGRSDFYGPRVGRDYMALYNAQYNWKTLLAKYRVESIFIPVDWPLGTVLKTSSDWRLVEDNGRVLYFLKNAGQPR